MKITRLAFAILAVSAFAACSSDVTGPTAAKTGVESANLLGTVGPNPNILGTVGPNP